MNKHFTSLTFTSSSTHTHPPAMRVIIMMVDSFAMP